MQKFNPHNYPRFDPDMIIDMDQDMGIVIKPAGLPTTPSRNQTEFNMQAYLSAHLGQAIHTPSRLDTGVSGVMMFSRSSRMNRSLQKLFEKRRISKSYIALVSGVTQWSNYDVTHRIGIDEQRPVLRRVVEAGGDAAHTRLSTLFVNQDESLVLAEPITGRTHQIRVHCAAEGHPIKGDLSYGGGESEALHLVSFGLSLFHPFRQEEVRYTLPERWRPEWLAELNTAPLLIDHRSEDGRASNSALRNAQRRT